MKIPKAEVIQAQIDSDIWDDELRWMDEQYREDYWEGLHRGEMSWQWYMSLSHHPEWYYIVISKDHKNLTVKHWLLENYPDCQYRYEREHFIFEDKDVATMVALKWT